MVPSQRQLADKKAIFNTNKESISETVVNIDKAMNITRAVMTKAVEEGTDPQTTRTAAAIGDLVTTQQNATTLLNDLNWMLEYQTTTDMKELTADYIDKTISNAKDALAGLLADAKIVKALT